MGEFVSYMMQVAVVMTLLYLAYKWLMATATFHRLNRFVLMAIYAVSWLLPVAMPLFTTSASDGGEVSVGLPISVMLVEDTAIADSPFDWWQALVWVYIAGVVAAGAFMLAGIVRMVSVICSGRHYKRSGYIEVVTDKAPAPFSWGRYVVVRPCDLDSTHHMVVAHEKAHLRLLHWLDLIPAQLTVVLQWFSPAAWLMMRELRDVHEFRVDELVAGDDPAEYQMMLIRKTVGSGLPIFADSLNHSQIKKRITMMMTKKSSPSRRVAALALPAVAALAVFTLSQPAVADVADRIGSVTIGQDSDGKISEKSAEVQTAGTVGRISLRNSDAASASDNRIDETGAVEVETEAVSEPAPTSKEKDTEYDAKPVYFVDGTLFTGNINSIDPRYIASMQVVKDDPEYPQGKIMITTKSTPTPRQREDGVYQIPEKIADYKGGMTALNNRLMDLVKYPADTENSDIPVTVRVIVQFVIGTDGTVNDAKIVKSGDEAFDAEALRVVKATSGEWIPAEQDGKPVPSMFTIPVTFKKK